MENKDYKEAQQKAREASKKMYVVLCAVCIKGGEVRRPMINLSKNNHLMDKGLYAHDTCVKEKKK